MRTFGIILLFLGLFRAVALGWFADDFYDTEQFFGPAVVSFVGATIYVLGHLRAKRHARQAVLEMAAAGLIDKDEARRKLGLS